MEGRNLRYISSFDPAATIHHHHHPTQTVHALLSLHQDCPKEQSNNRRSTVVDQAGEVQLTPRLVVLPPAVVPRPFTSCRQKHIIGGNPNGLQKQEDGKQCKRTPTRDFQTDGTCSTHELLACFLLLFAVGTLTKTILSERYFPCG